MRPSARALRGWLYSTASCLLLLLPLADMNRRHKVRENYKTSLLKSNIKHFRLNMYNSPPSQGIIKLRVELYTNNRGKNCMYMKDIF